MRKLTWLLPLLSGCGHDTAKQQAAGHLMLPDALAPAASAKPTVAYTSGDRETTGPLDTLHVGRGLVLRLVSGSRQDFSPALHRYPSFSEARLIRQEGDRRVQRVGHTLLVRPFNGPALRFTDDTYRMRKDYNEELGSQCRFLGSIPGRPYWLADSMLWERSETFLINKQSGHIIPITINSEPDISPNRQLLLIASPGLDGPIEYNALELRRITNQTVTKLWMRQLAHWQPQRVRWLDNHTISIEQLRFEPKQDTTYVRLLLP